MPPQQQRTAPKKDESSEPTKDQKTPTDQNSPEVPPEEVQRTRPDDVPETVERYIIFVAGTGVLGIVWRDEDDAVRNAAAGWPNGKWAVIKALVQKPADEE